MPSAPRAVRPRDAAARRERTTPSPAARTPVAPLYAARERSLSRALGMEPPSSGPPLGQPLFEQLEVHMGTAEAAVSAAENIVQQDAAFASVHSYCTSFSRLLGDMRTAVLQAKIFQAFLVRCLVCATRSCS